MTTKKQNTTPRPAAPPVAYHHHPAPDEIKDVPAADQYTYRSEEKARLLEELRQALISGAAGDSISNMKSGQSVRLRDGTVISRS
jgi:hypothetical protein